MPRGPKGGRHPADVIGNAVDVMRIATRKIEGTPPAPEQIDAQRLAFTAMLEIARTESTHVSTHTIDQVVAEMDEIISASR